MVVSLLQTASIIAVFQALLMALFSLQNKRNLATSNRLLALLLFSFSIITACSTSLTFTSFIINVRSNKLILLGNNFAFLIGPLLYFYIKSLINQQYEVRRIEWLHFIPFVCAVICSLIILQQYRQFYIWNYTGRLYFSGAILIQQLIYSVASLHILKLNGLTLKSFLSYIDNSRLAWMRFFVAGYIIFWSIQFQLFIGWDVLGSPGWCPYTLSLYFLTAFLFFNGIIFFGLKRPDVFQQNQKYQSSVLKQSDKDAYQKKILQLIDQEKMFLNPKVTLIDVAQKIDLAPCYVSQIINESFQQNFRDFINKYRIEESKRLLTQPNQNLNILGIALDAGFNSKSAFNSAFKKHTGITPKEFKRRTISSASIVES